MSFYQRLNNFRLTNESDRSFAARIGVRHPQIAFWRKADQEGMSGVSSRPNARTLSVVADALGVEPEWLLWGNE